MDLESNWKFSFNIYAALRMCRILVVPRRTTGPDPNPKHKDTAEAEQ